MLKHVGRPTARPRFIVLRKKRGRSGSRSWPGTPYTLSIASSSEVWVWVWVWVYDIVAC